MIARLHETISAVCPIDGVSGIQGSIRIDYKAEASQLQRDAALAALASFDWSQAAHDTWIADKHPDRKALRESAVNAISNIDSFLAIVNPTNAQTLAIIRKICQQNKQIIKRLVQID